MSRRRRRGKKRTRRTTTTMLQQHTTVVADVEECFGWMEGRERTSEEGLTNRSQDHIMGGRTDGRTQPEACTALYTVCVCEAEREGEMAAAERGQKDSLKKKRRRRRPHNLLTSCTWHAYLCVHCTVLCTHAVCEVGGAMVCATQHSSRQQQGKYILWQAGQSLDLMLVLPESDCRLLPCIVSVVSAPQRPAANKHTHPALVYFN